MTIGATLTNVCFVFCTRAAVGTCDVGLLPGFRLYARFLLRPFEFGALEGDAAHYGLRDFVVADVALDHIFGGRRVAS